MRGRSTVWPTSTVRRTGRRGNDAAGRPPSDSTTCSPHPAGPSSTLAVLASAERFDWFAERSDHLPVLAVLQRSGRTMSEDTPRQDPQAARQGGGHRQRQRGRGVLGEGGAADRRAPRRPRACPRGAGPRRTRPAPDRPRPRRLRSRPPRPPRRRRPQPGLRGRVRDRPGRHDGGRRRVRVRPRRHRGAVHVVARPGGEPDGRLSFPHPGGDAALAPVVPVRLRQPRRRTARSGSGRRRGNPSSDGRGRAAPVGRDASRCPRPVGTGA